ncbi:hypothetical protein ACWEN3_35225 [Streptomyces sp. NPDC004561]
MSELTTIALRHGGGRCTLELGATADAVNVAASDLYPRPRGYGHPDLNGGAKGVGRPMVRRHTAPGPGRGKTIRVRLPR